MQAQSASTVSLLRPSQVEDFKSEIKRIEEIEAAPPFVRNQISDFPRMVSYKRELARKLEAEAPKPLRADEIDEAVGREKELREAMRNDGMPTQAEMRRNPPGAVDKHRRWEARNKQRAKEWKNLRLRLAVSGALADCLPDSTDAASIERFRPSHHSGELNLDVAQITGKTFAMPDNPQSVVLTDAEIEAVRQVNPDLADKLALLSPAGRQQIKDAVARAAEETPRLISTATLEAMGFHQAFRLSKHFGLGLAGGTSKEALFAAILESHSGEPIPQL